jgi:serine/threonine protein kinase
LLSASQPQLPKLHVFSHVFPYGKVIISDLALAGILSSPGNKFCDLPATPWWRHDQSLEAELEQCGPKQDVWACGCLLYILLSRWDNQRRSSKSFLFGKVWWWSFFWVAWGLGEMILEVGAMSDL